MIGFLLHTAKVLPYARLDIPEKFNKGASLVYCNSILSKLWLAIEVNGDVLLTTHAATEASVHCKVLVLSSVGLKYITWQGDGEGICRSNV